MSIRDILVVLLASTILAATAAQAQSADWASPPGLERAKEAQERYTSSLMARDGVEGTAVGYNSSGEAVIKVYTARAGVPGIPQAFEQIPVDVVVSGRFVARADPTARFDRPVPIGVSSGHPDITAGTLGCRVKDPSGDVYALSNNHVYANNNGAYPGDSVLQPGAYDGGQDPADAIGSLFDYEPIDFSSDNLMDAAIADVSASQVGFATPSDGYGAPSSTTAPAALGQKVQKYGRTTGWTQGQVDALNATIDVCYQTRGPFSCAKSARFVGQIMITPGSFSDGGDSGSCIVTDDANRNPVGLLFAGSNTHTIANPIDPVLNRFNVTIDDGNGGGGETTNSLPTPDFTYETSDLNVAFTDLSTDPDGTVVGWSWNFGDGSTSTEQSPSHTYAEGGTYSVSLTVSDDDGATSVETSRPVSVSAPATGGGIALSATGYKAKGLQKTDLTWSGATSTNVDVRFDGAVIATPSNSGSYTHNINRRGGGSYTYMVCEAGTSTCSQEVTVTF